MKFIFEYFWIISIPNIQYTAEDIRLSQIIYYICLNSMKFITFTDWEASYIHKRSHEKLDWNWHLAAGMLCWDIDADTIFGSRAGVLNFCRWLVHDESAGPLRKSLWRMLVYKMFQWVVWQETTGNNLLLFFPLFAMVTRKWKRKRTIVKANNISQSWVCQPFWVMVTSQINYSGTAI